MGDGGRFHATAAIPQAAAPAWRRFAGGHRGGHRPRASIRLIALLPTRVARNGALYTQRGRVDILNARFTRELGPVMHGLRLRDV